MPKHMRPDIGSNSPSDWALVFMVSSSEQKATCKPVTSPPLSSASSKRALPPRIGGLPTPQAAKITKVLGFNVPQLLRHDDGTCIIEMSIVTRPFLLDFAGAYLEMVPEFSDDVWVEWEAEKQEQFGVRWPLVKAVLAVLEEMGIQMVDVSPSNIAFVD